MSNRTKTFKRTMQRVIEKGLRGFPVLLLTGPRQVGKTFLLESLAGKNRKYVTLDDLRARETARADPERFIQENPPPVMIDEVQYAPELFTYIKIHADKNKKDGLFWLTGSQKYRLMQGIQESLAGRVAILDMLGISYKETMGKPFDGGPFLPSQALIQKKPLSKPLTSPEVYKIIWEGSFPKLLSGGGMDRKRFYNSYTQTYISRDVKDFYNIDDGISFYNFLVASAARTGQLLNYSNLANDVHIDNRTAKLWMSILERSGIIQLLYPYSPNVTKRIIKTPKIYFLDTGLASYLTGWDSPESLMNGAQSGSMLETFAFGEILKSYWHNGDEPRIYFYRDNDQKEIDFVIEKNMTLYPMDVKKTAMPNHADSRNFKVLEKLGKKTGTGAILCLYHKTAPLPRQDVVSVPVWEI